MSNQEIKSVKFGRGGKVERGTASPDVIAQMAQHKAMEIVGEVRVSRAKQRILEYRQSADTPVVHVVNDGKEDWFVRSLSLPLHHQLSLRTPRDKRGKLDLSDGDKYTQFLAAILFVCLVEAEDDLTPFFDQDKYGWEEALEQANETGPMTVANSFIVNLALILNPDILPEATNELKRMVEEAGGDNPLAQGQESTKSLDTTPANGSTPTQTTTPPSTSQTDSLADTEAPPPTSSESMTSSD